MVKGKSRHVLILLYNSGLRPKDLIELGFPKASCYKYHGYFKSAKEEFLQIMKRK